MFPCEYRTLCISLIFSLVRNQGKSAQDWVPVSASCFCSLEACVVLKPLHKFLGLAEGHNDKDNTAALAFRAAVVSGVLHSRKLLVGSGARAVYLETAFT